MLTDTCTLKRDGTHIDCGACAKVDAKAKAEYRSIAQVRKWIEHGSDGPLSSFVLISRAMHVLTNSSLGDPCPVTEETVANALYESLADFNWLVRDPGDDR